VATAKVDHVEIDPVALEVIQEVTRRILADETETITHATEAVRLNRERIPSPRDRLAQLYGRPPKGTPWTHKDGQAHFAQRGGLGIPHARGTPSHRGRWPTSAYRRAAVGSGDPRCPGGQDRAEAPGDPRA
jgi:hypothetical protein